MLNIRRDDHDASSTHCWRVTVQRRKRIFLRDFSDGRHGGRQPAFQAARLYRDALINAHPPLSKPAYCAIRKKNNRSGISGLMRQVLAEVGRGANVAPKSSAGRYGIFHDVNEAVTAARHAFEQRGCGLKGGGVPHLLAAVA